MTDELVLAIQDFIVHNPDYIIQEFAEKKYPVPPQVKRRGIISIEESMDEGDVYDRISDQIQEFDFEGMIKSIDNDLTPTRAGITQIFTMGFVEIMSYHREILNSIELIKRAEDQQKAVAEAIKKINTKNMTQDRINQILSVKQKNWWDLAEPDKQIFIKNATPKQINDLDEKFEKIEQNYLKNIGTPPTYTNGENYKKVFRKARGFGKSLLNKIWQQTRKLIPLKERRKGRV